MKLQQVEWFAARRPEIAHTQRAADRKRMIGALCDDGDPLAADFERANEQADSALRVARTGGDYPWLSRGDVNLYALFVERAMALVGPQGVVGLLIDSVPGRNWRSRKAPGRSAAIASTAPPGSGCRSTLDA